MLTQFINTSKLIIVESCKNQIMHCLYLIFWDFLRMTPKYVTTHRVKTLAIKNTSCVISVKCCGCVLTLSQKLASIRQLYLWVRSIKA